MPVSKTKPCMFCTCVGCVVLIQQDKLLPFVVCSGTVRLDREWYWNMSTRDMIMTSGNTLTDVDQNHRNYWFMYIAHNFVLHVNVIVEYAIAS